MTLENILNLLFVINMIIVGVFPADKTTTFYRTAVIGLLFLIFLKLGGEQ